MVNRNPITLEYTTGKSLLILFPVAIAVVFMGIILNNSVLHYSPVARGLAEEALRLGLVLWSGRALRLIATASIVLSVAEFVSATAVNAILFEPGYFASFGVPLLTAAVSALSMLAFGVIAGMIYLGNYLTHSAVFWGFFVVGPAKSSYYLVNDWVGSAKLTALEGGAASVMILAILTVVALGLYKRNLRYIEKADFIDEEPQ